MAKEVMTASYNIYTDLERINASMGKAGSILGFGLHGQTIDFNPQPVQNQQLSQIKTPQETPGLSAMEQKQAEMEKKSMQPAKTEAAQSQEPQKPYAVVERKNPAEGVREKLTAVEATATAPSAPKNAEFVKIPEKPEVQGLQSEAAQVLSNNPVSKLLGVVKTKRSVTISEAAKELGVNKDLIETWAKILNQNNLLKIRYQLVGDMILES